MNTKMIPMNRAPAARGPKARVIDVLTMVKDAGVRWNDDNALRMGASLAYYAVFSIFPLLLLAVTVMGFVLGHSPETRTRLLDAVATATSPAFKTLFDETLTNMQTHQTARGVGAIVGLVTLFVGASAVFSELEASLNQIWRVKAPPSKGLWATVFGLVKDKALSFAVVIGAALALLVSLVVSSALSSVDQTVEGVAPGSVTHATLWIIAEVVGSVGVLTLVLAAMFRLIPQAKVEWRDVWGGALLTALLFTGSKRLLAWYLGHLGSYAAYGAVGGFLGLLTWIYLASLFLFFGAEFTRVYAERHGSAAGAGDAASGSLQGAGNGVKDDAGDPRVGPHPEAHDDAPVGGEGWEHESESATRLRAAKEAENQRQVERHGGREGQDDGPEERGIFHG